MSTPVTDSKISSECFRVNRTSLSGYSGFLLRIGQRIDVQASADKAFIDLSRDRTAASSHDCHVLFAAFPLVCNRYGTSVFREVRTPEHFARARIECAEARILRGSDEHQPACGRYRSAAIRGTCRRHAERIQLFERSQRYSPGDITGVDVDRDQLSPWRLLTRPALASIPEVCAKHRRRFVRA